MDRLSFFIFFLLLVIPISIIRIRQTFLIKGRKKGSKKEGWTLPAAISGYYCALFFSIIEFYLFIHPINYTLSFIGLIIGVLGFLITLSAIKSLGPDWSIAIELKENGEILTIGPYKWIRHPYYLGVILELIGLAIFLNAYYSVIFILIFQIPLLVIRGVIEENVLINAYETAYSNYKRQAGAIVPRYFRKSYEKFR